MYKNYGDKNFFENGRLIEKEENTETIFNILVCNPYSDREDLYIFGDCQVDTTDDWIDRQAVMSYIGMTDQNFDIVQYALGCIDYYGILEFGGESYAYDCQHMTMADIQDILKYRQIAPDNLDITW